jgi:hypothetical protein
LHWGVWDSDATDKPQTVEWWRNDADLLANTRDGTALPVGTLDILRHCTIAGEGIPLARMAGQAPVLMRSSSEHRGAAYFLGTLPGTSSSSLARDGVVMFALLHRALNEGGKTLGKAQQRVASATALGTDPSLWKPVNVVGETMMPSSLPLHSGVLKNGDRIVALNRPPGEDLAAALSPTALNELFAGLDFRVLTDSVEQGRSLTNEIWRTFLIAMAIALLGEALLCMPPRREVKLAPAT